MLNFIRRPFQLLGRLNHNNHYLFSLPKHDLLQMPALSPTMKEGKILKWLVGEGDKVQPGDAIAEIETDKATMTFQVQQKGYIAKMLSSDEPIPVGGAVAVLAKNSAEAKQFSDYKFGSADSGSAPASTAKTEKSQVKEESQKAEAASSKEYPSHTFLQMPAVSPTMQSGKILEWKIKPGDAFNVGDAIFSIETDKAVVDYEATEKGVLAKVIAESNEALPVNKNVAVIVKKKDSVSAFSDFEEGASSKPAQETSAPKKTEASSQQKQAPKEAPKRSASDSSKVFASPLAKNLAKDKNIDLSQVSGSGPNNRIIRQDVDNFSPSASQAKVEQKVPEKTVAAEKPSKQQAPKKKEAPKQQWIASENPYQQISLSSMRKTIASRLTESKQTIPHYYITVAIEMDNIVALRTELNKNEKQNGTKISVNDIIIKAMALALRDYPDVNVQWHGNSIRRFKYSDISVAVAIDGGLITPIIHRADTLGLIDISKKTKDLAKRARQGKLSPAEYTGGTSTISNLGMYGINTVSSIINPPQASILGVGTTAKKVLPSNGGSDPYRVAEVMEIISSCDHRAVDGALAAQWMTRIKHYLENPTHMLL